VQSDPRRALALAQGGYFVATGIWPLVHMPSFLRVTGRKHDLWLVRTVGALIAVAGAAILAAARRDRVTAEMEFLAAGTAAALGMVDAVYVSRRRIPPIYMLDGAAEAALVTLWLGLRRAARQSETSRADLHHASR
jgi:ABC-type cobalamin transport system permease subunit